MLKPFNTYFAPDEPVAEPAKAEPTKEEPKAEKTLTQSQVDDIVKGRVGETKRQTEQAIADQLGVPIEEAKKIIEDAKAADDKNKSDATLAREQADRERAAAEAEKTTAAKERQDAAIERALIRALPRDLEDDALDVKVTRLRRLIDVEDGADAEAIKKAVEALKKDEPLLFGVAEEGKGGGKPDSDPKGKPPVKKGSEDAFTRGAEKAKAATARTGYAILEGQK